MSRPFSIGFVGLGSQGGPIARRIGEAGHRLSVWARRAEAMAAFADCAASCESLPALASKSYMLCICVVDDDGVIEVARAALPHMAPGGLLVIMATIHPDSCIMLAREAADHGVMLLDAPVSGGGAAAEAGTLTVMLGGTEEACDLARPVLESFAGLIIRLGDVGAGQATKLVNNALMAANLMLAQEAAIAGKVFGIDPSALARVIGASSGRSFAHDVLASLPSLAHFRAAASLLAKDMGLFEALLLRHGGTVGHISQNGRAFLDIVRTEAGGYPP